MRKLLASAALAFGLAGLSTGGLRADDEKKADEKPTKEAKQAVKQLVGGYTIVSGEENGKAIPAERIKGSVVRFTKGMVVGTGPDKKEFFAATYTLDPTQKPWVIRMTSKSPRVAETTGLVKADGDTVTIIYALPGGTPPDDFKTEEMQQLFVLKKMMKDDKKEPKKKDKDDE